MGLLLFVLPYVDSFFFLSRFLVKDISTTVYDRNFKFGIEVCNDKLYCEIANRHSPICSSLPFCLVCEAEARHMYCFSGVVVVVVVVVAVGGGGGVNFLCLGHFLRNYKG